MIELEFRKLVMDVFKMVNIEIGEIKRQVAEMQPLQQNNSSFVYINVRTFLTITNG